MHLNTVYFHPIVPPLMLMNWGTTQYIAHLDDRKTYTNKRHVYHFMFILNILGHIWVILEDHTYSLLTYILFVFGHGWHSILMCFEVGFCLTGGSSVRTVLYKNLHQSDGSEKLEHKLHLSPSVVRYCIKKVLIITKTIQICN